MNTFGQQQSLALKWPEHLSFENFQPEGNTQVLSHLRKCVVGEGEFCTFLYALSSGVGRTHLLQAVCHAVTQAGKLAAYLSFKKSNYSPEILDGMDSMSLMCLDDIECIAGQRIWEEALFELYHRLLEKKVCFIISAGCLPQEIQWELPDLKSRLSAANIFQILPLSDDERVKVLAQRASVRGLELSKEVGQYLLSRFPRDMPTLLHTLDVLDSAALAAQRRLTIPFIKTVFDKVM
jgi:DnaA family protein